MSKCSSCGAPITWGITRAGKRIPIDEVPNPKGNLVRMDIDGNVRAQTPADPPELVRWMSHFATCENAAQHRKPKP